MNIMIFTFAVTQKLDHFMLCAFYVIHHNRHETFRLIINVLVKNTYSHKEGKEKIFWHRSTQSTI